MKQRVAVIGSGISGLFSAYLLQDEYDVVIYEAADRIGGHVATVDVTYDDITYAIDTGFFIFNHTTYPNLTRLFQHLDIETYPVDMSFSIFDKQLGVEYSENGFWGYFAQRKNLLSLQHWRLLREILSFNKQVAAMYKANRIPHHHTVVSFAKSQGYSEYMLGLYLIPICSAIWSVDREFVAKMPLQFFAQFFVNHGLLHSDTTLQWYTVAGGARSYLAPLTQSFAERIHTHCPIQSIAREGGGVRLMFQDGGSDVYDQVIIATHSNQAFQLLAEPTAAEQSILGAMEYQATQVSVHYDDSILPSNPHTWSDWNCGIGPQGRQMSIYYANRLHGFHAPVNFWVTINPSVAIDPTKVVHENTFSHPVFSHASTAAQQRQGEINGVGGVWYVGAYWGKGFHEDGITSAITVARELGSRHDFLHTR